MAFLGGLLSTLGPLIPGVIGTIGNVVKKFIDKPKDESFGQTLLRVAPDIIGGVADVAKTASPMLGGTAGTIARTVGDIAGDISKTIAKPSNGNSKPIASGEIASPTKNVPITRTGSITASIPRNRGMYDNIDNPSVSAYGAQRQTPPSMQTVRANELRGKKTPEVKEPSALMIRKPIIRKKKKPGKKAK